MSVKKRTYEILELSPEGDRVSHFFKIFILTLIVLNVLALMAETVDSIYDRWKTFFWWFEVFSVAIFSVEYILRLWSCTEAWEFRHPVYGRLNFMVKPLIIIDLLAILPFYLPFLLLDLRFLRSLRLFRIFRLVKVGRYTTAVQILIQVFRNKREELMAAVFILMLLLVSSSSLMYFAEHDTQPDKFSSIPDSMWYGIITLTTVGYGDVVPETPLGKVVGAFIAILGVGMYALPTGIIGAGFVEEMDKIRGKKKKCPHCGKDID
jgi:voltage-gated potassium channel